MTEFYIYAAVLSLLMTGAFIVLLSRAGRSAENNEIALQRDRDNLSWFDNREQELLALRDTGEIDIPTFEQLLSEAQQQLLGDVDASVQTASQNRSGISAPVEKVILLLAGLMVPLTALFLYLPQGFSLGADDQWRVRQQLNVLEQSMASTPHVAPQQSPQMQLREVEKLKHLLQDFANGRNPDSEILSLLAQAHRGSGEYHQAAQRFRQLLKREPDSVELLTLTAEAIYLEQLQAAADRPATTSDSKALRELLDRALKVQPDYAKALSLAGIVEFREQHWQAALDYWKRALPLYPPGSSEVDTVRKGIQAAAARLGIQTDSQNTSISKSGEITSAVKLQVAAALPDNAEDINPDTPVFVFARGTSGSRMPLAARRLRFGDLPVEVTLTNNDNMTAASIDGLSEVIVAARIALSGQPIASEGDYQSAELAIAVTQLEAAWDLSNRQQRLAAIEPVELLINQRYQDR